MTTPLRRRDVAASASSETSVARLPPFNRENPVVLLEQLRSGDYFKEVHENRYGTRTHYSVLSSFISAKTPAERAPWLTCLQLLSTLKASLDPRNGSAFMLYARGRWAVSAEVTAEAFRAHVDAGLIDLTAGISGDLLDPATLRGQVQDLRLDIYGSAMKLSPMAVGIMHGNAELVRELLGYGLSTDIGPVTKGGPAREASEFAAACGVGEVSATLLAQAMRSHLDSLPLAANDVESARRRRRMGV
jgi:hypothetical protein